MRLKAILKGNRLIFSEFIRIKKSELEVEVEVPDEDVRIYSKEELDKMSLPELAHLIWDDVEVDEREINRDYKELLTDALMEKYK
jgi:hypothetical protein